MICQTASYSHSGSSPENGDTCLVCQKGSQLLLLVADGLGGPTRGKTASDLVAQTIRTAFLSSGSFDPAAALFHANDRLMTLQLQTEQDLRATLSLAWLREDTVTFAQAGDSRIYAFRGGKLVFQSIDHSAAQLAAAVGEIPPAQIRTHPDRSLLTRALGASDRLKADLTTLPVSHFDALLLCTDGFWEYVLEEEMCLSRFTSPDPESWLATMRGIHTRRAPAGHDSHTAVAMMLQRGS